MLKLIEIEGNNKFIEKLNEKIKQYNDLKKKGKKIALQNMLLLEIDYLMTDIKNQVKTSQLNIEDIDQILYWNEIPNEIFKHQRAYSQLEIERALFKLTGSIPGKLFSAKQWKNETEPTFFSRLFNQKKYPSCFKVIKEKLELLEAQKNIYSSDYFYQLKTLSFFIIESINSQKLTRLQTYQLRILLTQVNRKIDKMIDNSPVLKKTYRQASNIVHLVDGLNKDLYQLQSQEATASQVCRNFKDQEKYLENINLLPSLAKFKLTVLSTTNNITCQLIDKKTKEPLCLRFEAVEGSYENKKLIQKLKYTAVNEFLAQDYMTFKIPLYEVAISEYAFLGDLHSWRNKEFKNDLNNSDDILKSSLEKLTPVLQFCQNCLKQGTIYSDIKLNNFLLNKEGKIIISDTKSFFPLNNDNIEKPQIQTTPIYTPPEYRQNDNAHISAEKFMVYQWGLALYEYLTLTDFSKKESHWTSEDLDFEQEIFQSNSGEKLKEIIKRSTHPNPQERANLAELIDVCQALMHGKKITNDMKKLHYIHATLAKGRKHTFKAAIDDSNKQHKPLVKYKGMKGDALKTAILNDFKVLLENTPSAERKDIINQFKQGSEYKILKLGQDKFTRIFARETSSLKAFNQICQAIKDKPDNQAIKEDSDTCFDLKG